MLFKKVFKFAAVALGLVALFGLAVSAAVRAAPATVSTVWISPEVKVSPTQTPTDADRYLPMAAYNSNRKQFLVVWHNQWSGSRDVYGQRLAADGSLLGPWFSISSGPFDRIAPAVAYNATDDEYLVVYMYDASGNGSRFEIMGQRVNWDGNKLGGAFQIATWPTSTMFLPRVVWKQSYDEYFVLWSGRAVGTNVPDGVAYSLIDNLGAKRYGTIISTADQPRDADVYWSAAADRYLVVWNYTNAAGRTAVMGDFRDANTNRIGGIATPFTIFTSDTNDALYPRVGYNGSFFMVVYEYVYSSSDHDIYGDWIASDASSVVPFLMSTTGAYEAVPALISNPARQEIMVLYQQSNGVVLRPVSNSLPYTDIPVCVFAVRDCINPAGAAAPNGYLMAYSAMYSGEKLHVYARFLGLNPAFLPLVRK